MNVSFDDDQLTFIFQNNIDNSGAMNYKDWLEKAAAEYAEDVEE